MSAIAKLFSLRAYVLTILVLLVLINVFVISLQGSSSTTQLLHSSNGLEQKIDPIFTDEYTKNLKADLIEARKQELMAQIKAELREKHEPEILKKLEEDVQNTQRAKYEEKAEFDFLNSLNDKFTAQYHTERTHNYNLLDELKQKYYEDNKEMLKDFGALSLLNTILEDQSGEEAEKLKKKVAEEMEVRMSKKTWYKFILRDLLLEHAPKMPELTKEEEGQSINTCHRAVHFPVYHSEFLSRVKFGEERVKDLKLQHTKLADYLRTMDLPPAELFQGQGIVISGGGEYFAGAIVAIIQLREAGSKLPVELMLNSNDEYDEHTCKKLEKEFNTRCVIIQNEIDQEDWDALKLTKFQLKILGLLVSSFDHTISLDADNMALINPDEIFSSDAYLLTRFVLWPDLWQRTIAPVFYDIAGIKPGEPIRRMGIRNGDSFSDYIKRPRDRIHFHDFDNLPDTISTETGQLAFSKREHFRSFVLALYYNVYGEKYYWRMMYQGSPGAGDRDTFVPALHVFNEPYHVVERSTWLAGFRDGNRFQETTIVQYEPASAQRFAAKWREYLLLKGRDTREKYDQASEQAERTLEDFKKDWNDKLPELPKVQFLHVHRPKLNPVLMTNPEGYFDCFKQRNLDRPGHYREHWGDSDLELRFNSIVQWVACKGINSDSWWKSVNRDQADVCQKVKEYVEFLRKDSQDPEAQHFQHISLD